MVGDGGIPSSASPSVEMSVQRPSGDGMPVAKQLPAITFAARLRERSRRRSESRDSEEVRI